MFELGKNYFLCYMKGKKATLTKGTVIEINSDGYLVSTLAGDKPVQVAKENLFVHQGDAEKEYKKLSMPPVEA